MQVENNHRLLYLFRDTCQNCCNDVAFPLPGSSSEGELLLQSSDGLDYAIVRLAGNLVFDAVRRIARGFKGSNSAVNPLSVLIALSDGVNGKELAPDLPICPVCKKRLKSYSATTRTMQVAVPYMTWKRLENLSPDEIEVAIWQTIDIFR